MPKIFTDNGAARGNRTRYFRDCESGAGVEWMYAVDHAYGSDRWYGYGMEPDISIADLQARGMELTALDDDNPSPS